ncbi:hypothetical protein PTKIN_Ptkin06aG0099300 [Pterospermum kingtungense]
MYDAYTPVGDPIPTNKFNAAKIFDDPAIVSEEPWYGIEQEYTLLQKNTKWPLGWPVGGFPGPQGPYYCGVEADKSFVMPVGISAGDQSWIARYILERITEIARVVLSFNPKPIPGSWNGAGAYTNYSTKSMRNDDGIDVIKKPIEKLGLHHKEYIPAYEEGNRHLPVNLPREVDFFLSFSDELCSLFVS